MTSPLRILMVTAEYAPLAKTGGLADMVTGLSRALAAAGHDVRVVLPRYLPAGGAAADDVALLTEGDVQVSPVKWEDAHPPYSFRQLPRGGPAEPQVCLLDAPALFSSGSIYGGGEAEARRFALLAHAALRLCEMLGWSPHIVHCHDWHAALAPVLLATGYRGSRVLRTASTVLTIHNIGYQGVFDASIAPDLGLVAAPGTGMVNFLRDGIVAADALTTVSPTHAAELLTPEYGHGLDPLLRQRRNRLVGILNGVDYSAWDPATDTALPTRYDATNADGKRRCRDELLRRAGFAPVVGDELPATPLLGMVTRLAAQKGIELVVEALPPLLRAGRVQLVILGQGDPPYVARLRELAAGFPGAFHYFDRHDEALARLVFAGSDAFLVPSIYEPCGLTQMYALRYGSVPVVRETGGLRDTVTHYDPRTGRGTGSVFKHADATGLAWAVGEVLDWYAQPAAWQRLRQNGMAEDYSWRHQAPRYAELYGRLVGTG